MNKHGRIVLEKTKNLKIEIQVAVRLNDPQTLQHPIIQCGAVDYPVITANEPNLLFPHKITYEYKDGTPALPDHVEEIRSEIGGFFTKQARIASHITDHKSFMSSPAWYMFGPLIKWSRFRDDYGVKMDLDDEMIKYLECTYYHVSYSESIINTLYRWVGHDIVYCNVDDCSLKNGTFTNPTIVLHKSVLLDESLANTAYEIASKWGLPIINNKTSHEIHQQEGQCRHS